MSSHHIVRDEQEPALIIHRWDQFPFEKFGSLLEWSPTIVCCGPAMDQVLQLGIKIDMAIVAFETRERYQQLLADQAPLKLLSISQPDYLSNGLQLLSKEGHFAVNVITTSSMTPEVIDLCEQFASKLQISVWDEEARHTLVTVSSFSKWFPEGVELEFYPLDASSDISIFLDQNSMVKDQLFVKKTEGIVKVQCKHPPFVMVEKHLSSFL